jgi:hypothetical protein
MFSEQCSQMENLMSKLKPSAKTAITTLGIAALGIAACGLTAAPALAGGSAQHSVNAAGLSGQASSEGSAAVAKGATTVLAVPLVVFGAGISISGAALADVGGGSVAAGSDLAHAAPPAPRNVKPNGAPTLD